MPFSSNNWSEELRQVSIGWILRPESDASEWEANARRTAHYRVVKAVHTLEFWELNDFDLEVAELHDLRLVAHTHAVS